MASIGGIAGRLYRGEVSINFVGRQRLWYSISGVILLVSAIALLVKGLNFSLEFRGGSSFTFPNSSSISQEAISRVVTSNGGGDASVQLTSTAARCTSGRWRPGRCPRRCPRRWRARSSRRSTSRQNKMSVQLVGPTWGGQITSKAVEALIIFLVVIVIYLSIAFEWRMAVAAFVALMHDILITVGVYALTGFSVSPTSVIGLLTILGYSLYDTVVVFDKVRENTAGLLTTQRSTYSDAANLALNQTLVRSINTSLTALMPVAVDPVRRGGPARRGHAEGPGPGAVRRHAVRHLLLDLHRDPGSRRPQGARARSTRTWPSRSAAASPAAARPSAPRSRRPAPPPPRRPARRPR